MVSASVGVISLGRVLVDGMVAVTLGVGCAVKSGIEYQYIIGHGICETHFSLFIKPKELSKNKLITFC